MGHRRRADDVVFTHAVEVEYHACDRSGGDVQPHVGGSGAGKTAGSITRPVWPFTLKAKNRFRALFQNPNW